MKNSFTVTLHILTQLHYVTAKPPPTTTTTTTPTTTNTTPTQAPRAYPQLCRYIADTQFQQCGNIDGILQRRASRAWNRVNRSRDDQNCSSTEMISQLCRNLTKTGE